MPCTLARRRNKVPTCQVAVKGKLSSGKVIGRVANTPPGKNLRQSCSQFHVVIRHPMRVVERPKSLVNDLVSLPGRLGGSVPAKVYSTSQRSLVPGATPRADLIWASERSGGFWREKFRQQRKLTHRDIQPVTGRREITARSTGIAGPANIRFGVGLCEKIPHRAKECFVLAGLCHGVPQVDPRLGRGGVPGGRGLL